MTMLKTMLDWPTLAADYAQYHTHPMNRLCHTIGIPLIMLAVVRWTQWPEVSYFPAAAVVLPLYAAWNPTLALGMAAAVFGMAALAPSLNAWIVFASFVVGWIFQLVGHSRYEGKSPAFMRNLIHLLVGPMWVLSKHLEKDSSAEELAG